ncbi:MAG: ABC transporter permease subunit [Micromonosporaceae bacterium]|nr:ABC transporter permease subunit [Micromonosporaceae bacterium]
MSRETPPGGRPALAEPAPAAPAAPALTPVGLGHGPAGGRPGGGAPRPVQRGGGWWLLFGLSPQLALYLVVFLVPLVGIVVTSLGTTDAGQVTVDWSPTQYVELFTDPFYAEVLVTTLVIGIATTLLCVVLAYPVALRMTRVRPWVQGLILVLLVAPLFTDPNVRTLGQLTWLSDGGLLNSILTGSGLVDSPVRLLGTQPGVILALAQIYLPFMVLPIYASLESIDKNLSEAASSLGVGPARRFATVTLPNSAPGIVAGSFAVFLLSITAFVTPSVIGSPGVVVVSTLIYQKINVAIDWSFASASAVVLMVLVLVVTLVMSRQGTRSLGRGSRSGSRKRRRGSGPVRSGLVHTLSLRFLPDLRLPRLVGTVYAGAVVLFIILPLLLVGVTAFTRNPSAAWPPDGFTLEWMRGIFGFTEYWRSFSRSVLIAVTVTAISVVLALASGLLIASQRRFNRETLTSLLLVPLLVPQIVLSIALLRYAVIVEVPRGLLVLMLGHLLITVPFATRSIASGIYGLDWSVVEASGSLGAGRLRTLVKVILPLLRPTIVVAALYATVMSFINVAVSLFLSSPGAEPLPIFLFSQVSQSYQPGYLAAFATILAGISVVLTLLLHRVVGLQRFTTS